MTKATANINKAIGKWSRVIGEKYVVTQPSEICRYVSNTTGISRYVPAVLFPKTIEDIPKILHIAVEQGVSLHPVGTGYRLGLGSACPWTEGCTIINLSRLDRIQTLDRELGIVKVQAGVTMQQLYAYLRNNKIPYVVPGIDYGAPVSLVDLAVERGFTFFAPTDLTMNILALQAVLPNGTIYRSPLASGVRKGRSEVAFKWGLGPYLDGLFSQSNLGIVAEITIALPPLPREVSLFHFHLENQIEEFEEITHALYRILRSAGQHMGFVKLADPLSVLVGIAPSPFNLKGVPTKSPPNRLKDVLLKYRLPEWSGSGLIFGDPGIVAEICSIMRHNLRKCTRALTFSSGRILRKIPKSLPNAEAKEFAEKLDDLTGKPSGAFPRLYYWKSGEVSDPSAPNPDLDGCGLIWYYPIIPFNARHLRRFLSISRHVGASYKIDLPISFATETSGGNRVWRGLVPILFNRNDAREVARATKCYQELFQVGERNGFYAQRVPSTTKPDVSTSDTFMDLALKIKQLIDPHHVLSPGHYFVQ